ncbi:MAG: 6-phosphogluconolactonase [Thermoplasmata archaeon]
MVPRLDRRIERFPDLARASAALARRLCGEARKAVRSRGRFRWVISGGKTPLGLYRTLGGVYRDRFPWAETELFFADERCVPPTDPDSNFGAAWATFLSRVPIPRARLHRMRGELRPPPEAAARYARSLGPAVRLADPGTPRFDVVLLGIGPDGHTASLFPGQPAVRERRRSVVAVRRGGLPPYVPRLTMTPLALSSAREAWFLVAGSDKAEAIAGIFRPGRERDPKFPAGVVRPAGPSRWFLDRAAASGLPAASGRRRDSPP